VAGSWRDAGDQEDEGPLPVLRKEMVPNHEVRTAKQRGTWSRFGKNIRTLSRYVGGYAWGQADRLREAKIREVESSNEEREASVRKLDAEAEFLFAQAEQTRLGTASQLLDLTKTEAGLLAAISRIELQGGSVAFVDEDGDDGEA